MANEPIGALDRTEAEIRDQIDQARERLEEIDKRVRRAVRERPVVAMGSALLLGYALGRLFRRR